MTLKKNGLLKNFIDEVWDKLNAKLLDMAQRSRNKLPYTTQNGTHDNNAESSIDAWTNGFWPGLMWLMYNATKNDEYRLTAECGFIIPKADWKS